MEFTHHDVAKKFRDLYPGDPVLVRSPARINLIGEHTDYNDGFVMPAAVDKEIVFAIAPSDEALSKIFSLNFQEEVLVNLNETRKVEQPLWLNYLLGILQQLRTRGYVLKSFNCVIGSTIPAGAGMSSSAALECGFVYALNVINRLNLDKVEMIKISQWSEHNYAGVQCGIMDQFSSMMGKEDHVFVLDCRSLSYQYFPINLPHHTIVLLNSNVKHSLASSEYNTRRQECEQGVTILQQYYSSVNSLRDVTTSMLIRHKEDFPRLVYDRCRYVVDEITRVQQASEDLQRNDIEAFGRKMFETHKGLSKLYDVSCAELDYLVEQARTFEGVLGARVMGGGFGGCTINIVVNDRVEPFIKETRENYRKTFNIDLPSYIVKIKDGTSVIA